MEYGMTATGMMIAPLFFPALSDGSFFFFGARGSLSFAGAWRCPWLTAFLS